MADTPLDLAPPDAPAFAIEKIYVKDLSLENPGSPQSFRLTEPPQVEIGLRTRGDKIDDDTYECVLTVTMTAKAGDKTLFLIEASQAGVFTIKNIPRGAPATGDGGQLPECAVPVHPRDARRRGDQGRISAGAPRADQLRGALSAAARAGVSAGAGDRRRQLTIRRWRSARQRGQLRAPADALPSARTRRETPAALRRGRTDCRRQYGATAAEFRSVADPAVVLYDAPSLKGKPLYILGRGTPLEVLVPVEGWVKVKDVDGTFGWVEKKGLAERRMLIARRRLPKCAPAPMTRRRSSFAPSRGCCSSSPSQ